jgi:hypothetical protein
MRLVSVAFACLLLASTAWGEKGKPGDERVWPAGQYQLSDIEISGAPQLRPDGTSWDPHGGPADLYLVVFTSPGGDAEWVDEITTAYVEDAGTGAAMGSWILTVNGPGDYGPETNWLWFQVVDYDPQDLEVVDESGSILLEDLLPEGWNSVVCSGGTVIEFTSNLIGR